MDKQHGKGTVMRLGDHEQANVDVISTGSLSLDAVLGIGGIPRGRITEIYGAESSGKTTLALHILANAQKDEGLAAFVDVEHALSLPYAEQLGVDIENLVLCQPDNAEQALTVVDDLVRTGIFNAIVVDSVAALVPKTELEGESGDACMGLQARLMGQAMRKITPVLGKSKTCLIFINQLRQKIGVVFGSPDVTCGGNALKFYASIRLDIRKSGNISAGDQITGNRVRVKVAKNKFASPFKVAEFDIIYGSGISKIDEIIDIATEAKILTKSGAWYSYGEQRLGHGKEASKKYFEDHPELQVEIEEKVRAMIGSISIGKGPTTPESMDTI
jgi:recombination protein RecA